MEQHTHILMPDDKVSSVSFSSMKFYTFSDQVSFLVSPVGEWETMPSGDFKNKNIFLLISSTFICVVVLKIIVQNVIE